MRRLLLLATALLFATPPTASAQSPDPRQDTTYTVSADRGTPTATYLHYFTLTRRDSMIGVVLEGADTPYAGSCRAAWCALVPANASNGVGQSGGTFRSFNDAAHEVVRAWNVQHLATFTPPPPVVTPPPTTPPPADTTSPPSSGPDTSYRTVRIQPTPAGAVTAYEVWQGPTLLGRVIQAPAGKWTPALPSGLALPPTTTTLKAAAARLVAAQAPSTPPVTAPPTDTAHHRVDIFDTVRTTITLPPDTLRPRIILPVDTVLMRVGDPPLVLQTGDTIKIPIRVLPKCSCTSTGSIDTTAHTIPAGSSVAAAGVDTSGIHLYDWPSRVGDNSVYSGTTLLGRIQQDASGRWLAYRSLVSDPDPIILRRDCSSYATKPSAMQALATPPNAVSLRTDPTRMVVDATNGCANTPGTTSSATSGPTGQASTTPALPRTLLTIPALSSTSGAQP